MARPADPRRRETILRAATEVFTERGFSEARLADIARRAGVAAGTLYLYFDSKEAMVRAIAEDSQRELLERLGPALRDMRTEDGVARFVDVVIAFARERRDRVNVLRLDEGLRGARRGTLRRAHGAQLERGVDVIRDLTAEGCIAPLDPDLTMDMLVATTGWIMRRAARSATDEAALRRFAVQWLSRALLTDGR